MSLTKLININSDETDSDYLLAIQMQFIYEDSDNEDDSKGKIGDFTKPKMEPVSLCRKNESLVDTEFESVDPCPDIRVLFQEFDKKYFYSRLGSCIVEWSKRMTICAGIFYLREGGIIRLSEPLLKYRSRKNLIETLLHEMIHAYLYLTRNFRDRDGHGDEFKKHMRRINEQAGTDISIYHDFHDEVNYQRQHVWRCNGACRTMKPFFGYVKRSMNRAPGPNDVWWNDHKFKCSGTFEKVAEPEGYASKKQNAKRKSDENTDEQGNSQKPTNNLTKKKKSDITDAKNKIEKYLSPSQITNTQQATTSAAGGVAPPLKVKTFQTSQSDVSSKTLSQMTLAKYVSPTKPLQTQQTQSKIFSSMEDIKPVVVPQFLSPQKLVQTKSKITTPIKKTPLRSPKSKDISPASQLKLTSYFTKTPTKVVDEKSDIKTEPQDHGNVKKALIKDEDDIVFVDEIKIDSDILIVKETSQELVECPLCFVKFTKAQIDVHVNAHF